MLHVLSGVITVHEFDTVVVLDVIIAVLQSMRSGCYVWVELVVSCPAPVRAWFVMTS